MNSVMDIMGIIFDLHHDKWTIIAMIIFFMLIFDFSHRIILSLLGKKATQKAQLWSHAFLITLKIPLSIIIWVTGWIIVAKLIFPGNLWKIFDTFWFIGIVYALASFGLSLVQTLHDNIVNSRKLRGDFVDLATANAIARLVKISISIIAFLLLLRAFGVGITGILAFGGIGGIAIGFAARDILANFFGSLGIFLDRPFAVGDWIRSPDKNIEGVVEYIGWRLTRIRTFENRPLYVPNAIFSNISLENPSRMTHRRIRETIGVRHEDIDKVTPIVADIRQMLTDHPDIDQEKGITAHFTALSPSSLDILVNVHTQKTKGEAFNRVKGDILLKIYHIIQSHGARIALPASAVYLTSPHEEKTSVKHL